MHTSIVNWKYYLSEVYLYDKLQQSPLLDRLDKARRFILPYYDLIGNDLRYLNCAKTIIKEPIKKFPGHDKYPPYCFRFQCLQTGRVSKYIKVDEWANFGITKRDGQTGGDYPEKQNIDDKMVPIFDKYNDYCKNILDDIKSEHKSYNEIYLWHNRYGEYLQSQEWRDKRELVLARDKYRCIMSGKSNNLQVHHIHYSNVGDEDTHELITLCKSEHDLLHSVDIELRRKIEYNCMLRICGNNFSMADKYYFECWRHSQYMIDKLTEYNNVDIFSLVYSIKDFINQTP